MKQTTAILQAAIFAKVNGADFSFSPSPSLSQPGGKEENNNHACFSSPSCRLLPKVGRGRGKSAPSGMHTYNASKMHFGAKREIVGAEPVGVVCFFFGGGAKHACF